MTKKHLRIIISGLGVGGAERNLSYILPELAQRGFLIRVILLSQHQALVPYLREKGIEVQVPRTQFTSYLASFISLVSSLYRLVRDYRRNPDAITHFFLPESYILGIITALIARSKGPRIMSRRSLNCYQKRRPMVGWLEKYLHQFTTFILANSQRVLSELRDKESIPSTKLGLIYNGIDEASFLTSKPAHVTKTSLNISEDALVFIIVANLIPYKGHQDLLEAFALIKNKLPQDWHLLVVGDDARGIQAELETQAIKSGIADHIHWLGRRADDIPDLLNIADIGILASHEEGFSNAAIEGMAAGLPMIVTDVGGNAEAVIHEENGLVIPPHDPQAMGEALHSLALNLALRTTMGQKSKQRVTEHFTLKACVDRYEMLYIALINGQLPKQSSTLEISLPDHKK